MVKYTNSGNFISCKEKMFKNKQTYSNKYNGTIDVLSNFDGKLLRVVYNEFRGDQKENR